jgi:Flp pilus assembly CpaE family ATPase
MASKVLLITLDPTVREQFNNILAESDSFEIVGIVPDGASARTALERDADIAVIVVDEGAESGNGHGVARSIAVTSPLVGVVMLVPTADPGALARAMDVGARSVIAHGAGLDEVVARLESVATWSAAARATLGSDRASTSAGEVLVVAGAKGGVGTSTLALMLAQATAQRQTVTAVDFDLSSGDLAAYAGVSTRRSVVDLAEVAGEITGRMLRETSYELPGGVRLLPAPSDGERGEEMTGRAARAIVSGLRYESDLAVVDVGSHLNDSSASVIEFADRALLVVNPNLPSLRAARRTLAQWDRLAIRRPESVQLVLNRRSPRDEVTRQLAERIVERPVAFTIPEGGPAFENAMNTATLMESQTPVHRAVVDVVSQPATSPEHPDAIDGRPARPAPRQRKARRGRRAGAGSGERGQAAMEFPVVIALAIALFLICAQGIAWASGLMVARAAAQEGARTVGIAESYNSWVADDARDDVRERLPEGLRDTAVISVSDDVVSVRVRSAQVIPGLRFSASSSADVFEER